MLLRLLEYASYAPAAMTKRLVAVLVLAAGCDAFNKVSAQAAAPHVMVATVLATPEIHIVREAITGFDASFPTFDAGGFPFDAGGFDAGGFNFNLDGGITVPAQTAIIVFFGERMGTDLTMAPSGVDGALLTAGTKDHTWTLTPQSGGQHKLTSQDDPSLQYASGVTWSFAADAGMLTYVGDVEDAPGNETIFQLHPSAGYIELDAGATYELTRPDPPEGQQRNLGFVTVFPIDVRGQQGVPTFTDVPDNPLEFLKLATAPSKWEQTVIKIPGSAFPDAQRNYVILLQTAKLGGPSTDNLFLGSPMIAGATDVGVVKTR
jgi:hypothetical protein